MPQESDEWMIRELKKLVQFTRIFPPEQTSSSKGDKDEEENDGKDEDGDDDGDKEDAVEGSDAAAASSSAAANAKPSVKSANYEEIMVQVRSKPLNFRLLSNLIFN